MKIIDAHHHIGYTELFGEYNAEVILSMMEEYGVEKAVLMPLYPTLGNAEKKFSAISEFIKSGRRNGTLLKLHKTRIDHRVVIKAIKKYPGKFIGFYAVNPWLGKEGLVEAERAVVQYGFRGLKLHPVENGFPANHTVVYPVMELAIRLDVPVMFHTGLGPGTECFRVGEIGRKFPEAKIIMGHAGILQDTKDAIRFAKQNKNVFLELSATAPIATKWIIEEAPPEQILFGSDGPFGHPYIQLAKVVVARPSKKAKELILRENIFRLLKIG